MTNEEAATSSFWLNLYQYKKSLLSESYISDVWSERFFFSTKGKSNPHNELVAAIQAFSNPQLTFGTQKQPAACVFPARKKILEKLLDQKFPEVKCPDLQEWLSAIHADRVNIVFAGAYGGNPASVLGHTFLRFYNDKKERTRHGQGQDLLSYSVGFMALPERKDSRPLYMLKGLTGGYPGFYEIEPHYLKVGLYNNSESRDLWEWPLKLDPSQVELLLLHLWELTFNAQFKYYFIGENCSYRLITMLELVEPDRHLSQDLASVVLPAETVRLLQNKNIIDLTPRYRASLGRRIQYKAQHLSDSQQSAFQAAKKNLHDLSQLKDPVVLDVLIDYWTYENYKVQTRLKPKDKELMNATFSSMAQQNISVPQLLEDETIRSEQKLLPLTQSHPPRWYSLSAGSESENVYAQLSARLGTHALWQDDRGYDKVSWIEYLGFDYKLINHQDDLWNAVILKAYSLDPVLFYTTPISWQFETGAGNRCTFCASPTNHFYLAGGGGLTFAFHQMQIFALAHIKSELWTKTGPEAVLAPGYLSGLQWRLSLANLLLQHQQHWFKKLRQHETRLRFTGYFSTKNEFFIEFQHLSQQFMRRTQTAEIGLVHFF